VVILTALVVDHHVDLILGNLAVVTAHVLFLDPGAADIVERLLGSGEALLDGVLEAFRRRGTDLRHLGDRHSDLLLRNPWN